VTGCYAQRDAEVIARIRGVDAVIGNTHKTQLVQISSDGIKTGKAADPADGLGHAVIFRDDFAKIREIDMSPGIDMGDRTRPYVKIQDGCDAKCSYCIIPAVRGPSRSVPPDQILSQVRSLSEQGFKEVVLTGIHMGTYGMHMSPRFPLYRLLEEMLRIPSLIQVRISSIEPMQLSRRVIDLAARSEGKIVPHFHICLQSGSDRTLKRMIRPYTGARFSEIACEIREKIPDAGIGTDVITGFPGETEEDHSASLEFVQAMPFTYIHVFPYSDRSGTRAATLGEKVAPETIYFRSREMREVSLRQNLQFRQRFIGRKLKVLTIDDIKDGMRTAVAGNYLQAKVDPSIPPNQLLEILPVASEGGYLIT
jgi:threonylcarbamoyladenosine tRNA methylthiotransferase MtaB